MTATLTIDSSESRVKQYKLQNPVFTIGRNSECCPVIRSDFVSRVHARIAGNFSRPTTEEAVFHLRVSGNSTNGSAPIALALAVEEEGFLPLKAMVFIQLANPACADGNGSVCNNLGGCNPVTGNCTCVPGRGGALRWIALARESPP